MHREIALINGTTLGLDPVFHAYLHVKYEGATAQGIGGYCLDEPVRDADGKFLGRVGTAEGAEFIRKTIETVGVDQWEKLPGKSIWVLQESDMFGAKVLGIQGMGFGQRADAFIFADLFTPEAVSAGFWE